MGHKKRKGASIKKKYSNRSVVRSESARSNLYHVLEEERATSDSRRSSISLVSYKELEESTPYSSLNTMTREQYEALTALSSAKNDVNKQTPPPLSPSYECSDKTKNDESNSHEKDVKTSPEQGQSLTNGNTKTLLNVVIDAEKRQRKISGTPGGKYNTEDYVYM